MRSTIITAAIFTVAASTSFAQIDNQPLDPAGSGATHSPPISELAPTTEVTPSIHDEVAPALHAETLITTEEQATAKIEGEGYTQISGLMKDGNGMWTATAMKDGKPVQLSLNDQGNIAVLN